MNAYILIHTQVGRGDEAANAARSIGHVTKAELVTGPYDVIVKAEAEHLDQIEHDVVPLLQAIPGVIRTITCPLAGHQPIWDMGSEPADLLAGAVH